MPAARPSTSRKNESAGKLDQATLEAYQAAHCHLLAHSETPYLSHLTLGLLHKFNNVITGVVFAADDCLTSVEEDAPVREYLTTITSNLREALTFIERVVHLHVNEQDDDASYYTLDDLLEWQTPILKLLVPKGSSLELVKEPDQAIFYGSRRAVQEILLHLVGNAGEAISAPTGAVWITISETAANEEKRTLVKVRDNGPGISPQVIGRLFQPFVTTKPAPSIGLGLHRAQQLARTLNAELTGRNHPEGGAEFTLSLPQNSPETDEQEFT